MSLSDPAHAGPSSAVLSVFGQRQASLAQSNRANGYSAVNAGQNGGQQPGPQQLTAGQALPSIRRSEGSSRVRDEAQYGAPSNAAANGLAVPHMDQSYGPSVLSDAANAVSSVSTAPVMPLNTQPELPRLGGGRTRDVHLLNAGGLIIGNTAVSQEASVTNGVNAVRRAEFEEILRDPYVDPIDFQNAGGRQNGGGSALPPANPPLAGTGNAGLHFNDSFNVAAASGQRGATFGENEERQSAGLGTNNGVVTAFAQNGDVDAPLPAFDPMWGPYGQTDGLWDSNVTSYVDPTISPLETHTFRLRMDPQTL